MARGPYKTSPTNTRLRLRQVRDAAGLTQTDLAELVDKDTSTISKWERGEQNFSVLDLLRVADALKCPPAALIENGDGLSDDERGLIIHLRTNPIHKKILLSTLDTLIETVPPVAAE